MKEADQIPMEQYYSVRMRAAKNGPHEEGGKHISGGEQIATFNNLKKALNTLLDKGMSHSRGIPDFMQIQFEMIHEPIMQLGPLSMDTHPVASVEEGQETARELLASSGVPKACMDRAYQQIKEFSKPRGAVLYDIRTNKRIDERKDRGVRVSRMDWQLSDFSKWAGYYDLPVSSKIKEALALATKVNRHPATVAELCWSDDPEYITGYVASKAIGYHRIAQLKHLGDEQGCRIFFIDGSYHLEDYINYLEKQPVFIHWEDDNGTRIN